MLALLFPQALNSLEGLCFPLEDNDAGGRAPPPDDDNDGSE